MILLVETPQRQPWTKRQWIIASSIILLCLIIGVSIAWIRKQPVDPDALSETVANHLKAGELDVAQTELVKLLKLRDPTPLDWMLRAQLALAKGSDQEAFEHLDKVLNNTPFSAQARLKQGQIELRRDRAKTAESFYLKAIELDPKQAAAHSELIFIYGYQLRRRELRDRYLALSECRALNFHDVFTWCLTRNTTWEAREAVETLEKFAKADPDDHWSRIALADNLRMLNRLDDAETALKGVPESDPNALEARARLAVDRNQWDRVEELLKKAPTDPVQPGLACLQGKQAMAKRDPQTAIQWYRKAYQADPEHRDAVAGLAQALKVAGDPEAAKYQTIAEAHNKFNQILEQSHQSSTPPNAKTFNELGTLCSQMGRIAEARAWHQLALDLEPLNAEAQTSLFRLNKEQDRKP